MAEVRLVGPAGEQVGVVRVEDALRLAQEANLDLVEVAPNANPPVAKLMDYGKFKYEAAQKARESRRNQANTQLKEMRLGLKIDQHDYETKLKRIIKFSTVVTRSRFSCASVAVSSLVQKSVSGLWNVWLPILQKMLWLNLHRASMVAPW